MRAQGWTVVAAAAAAELAATRTAATAAAAGSSMLQRQDSDHETPSRQTCDRCSGRKEVCPSALRGEKCALRALRPLRGLRVTLQHASSSRRAKGQRNSGLANEPGLLIAGRPRHEAAGLAQSARACCTRCTHARSCCPLAMTSRVRDTLWLAGSPATAIVRGRPPSHSTLHIATCHPSQAVLHAAGLQEGCHAAAIRERPSALLEHCADCAEGSCPSCAQQHTTKLAVSPFGRWSMEPAMPRGPVPNWDPPA